MNHMITSTLNAALPRLTPAAAIMAHGIVANCSAGEERRAALLAVTRAVTASATALERATAHPDAMRLDTASAAADTANEELGRHGAQLHAVSVALAAAGGFDASPAWDAVLEEVGDDLELWGAAVLDRGWPLERPDDTKARAARYGREAFVASFGLHILAALVDGEAPRPSQVVARAARIADEEAYGYADLLDSDEHPSRVRLGRKLWVSVELTRDADSLGDLPAPRVAIYDGETVLWAVGVQPEQGEWRMVIGVLGERHSDALAARDALLALVPSPYRELLAV